ncbi:MAG: 50S ribosomal protein L18 [Sedimentisphaerales bacterium]|nr:50S ribosomal protein L18 [Sedimentisphaerales bacterium]
MDKNVFKQFQHRRRKRRVRKKVFGSVERPRMSVYRSLRHMYVQLIDDDNGATLVAASTLTKEVADQCKQTGNRQAATLVGQVLARKALDIGIHQVRFDRNGMKYHGRIQAMAEAARKAGLVF